MEINLFLTLGIVLLLFPVDIAADIIVCLFINSVYILNHVCPLILCSVRLAVVLTNYQIGISLNS